MGSDFLNNKLFQKTLEENPEQISWSSLREVILQRGSGGKLGFKVHTFQVRFIVNIYLHKSGVFNLLHVHIEILNIAFLNS